jgi:hypothetical protein
MQGRSFLNWPILEILRYGELRCPINGASTIYKFREWALRAQVQKTHQTAENAKKSGAHSTNRELRF